MALVDATLSAALQAIDTQMLAAAETGTPWTSAQYRDAMAAALDTQTKTATVNSTVAVTSVMGVTTGGGVSGPGTGTATGTIS